MCGGSGEKIEEPKLGGKPNTGPKMQPGPWGGDMELEKKNKVLLKDGKVAPGTKAYSQRAGTKT